MQLIRTAALLSLSALALANAEPDLVEERDDGRPQGAAAIESAVTDLASSTDIPAAITSLAGALNSAGITGVLVSPTSAPTSNGDNSNGDNNYDNNNQNGNKNDNGDNNGNNRNGNNDNGAAGVMPQVVLAGTAAAFGMVVLGLM